MNEVVKNAVSIFHQYTYDIIPTWVANHPLRTDGFILVGALLFAIYLLGRQKKARRRAHRLYRGIMMRRENLTAWQRMRFEEAITSAGLDMNVNGEMNDDQEKEWYRLFHIKMGMDGLVPRKSPYHIKRAIKTRLYRLGHEIEEMKNKVRWWGPTPFTKVDESYTPQADEPPPLTSRESKYANKGEAKAA